MLGVGSACADSNTGGTTGGGGSGGGGAPRGYFSIERSAPAQGLLSARSYASKLHSYVYDGKVSLKLNEVLETHGCDRYTDVPAVELRGGDLSCLFEDARYSKVAAAYDERAPGDSRNILEVDHIWDMQLWDRAIEIVHRQSPLTDGARPRALTFSQAMYLSDLINSVGNLNVTSWKINGISKNKLVSKFLTLYDFLPTPQSPETWCYASIMATVTWRSADVKELLQLPTGAGTVGQRIGRCMVATLEAVIKPQLSYALDGAWTAEERAFFADLLTVLQDMCHRLWPGVEMEQEQEQEDDE